MLAEDISANEIRYLAETICSMDVRRNGEDLVEFLEGFALSFGQEQEYEDEADHIPRGVPRESALVGECGLKGRPRDGENEVEEPGCSCCEGHAVCAHVEWVCFRGIGEGDGTFAWGIDHSEEIDSERNACCAGGCIRFRDPETESGEEEKDRH